MDERESPWTYEQLRDQVHLDEPDEPDEPEVPERKDVPDPQRSLMRELLTPDEISHLEVAEGRWHLPGPPP